MLCDVIAEPELKSDPRFLTNKDRVINRVALAKILNTAFENRDASEWLAKLQEADIPCSILNSIPDVFNHPQAPERDFRLEIQHPTAGLVAFAGFPYKMSHTPAELHCPPPLLGEHTEEVLTKLLGYSSEQVTLLAQNNVV
jgi:crotonobetainyl-CoA:carnitine CoA-transferase CaiB-like acyl-CoA transferase